MTLVTVGARRRTPPPVPDPSPVPTLTWTSADAIIVPGVENDYYAFPGAIVCPNGDVLAMFRNGPNHLGAGDLMEVRSTDNGATWSSPAVAIPKTATHGYGTATFSLIDATTIALVTWMRPLVGGHPPIDAARIFLSTDNGATWSSPYLVDTAEWLTEYNVSESALIYRDGWYYLGVWGEALGNDQWHFMAGVVRSANLSTWERVALFDTGEIDGYNEIGVVQIGGYLVALVRNETAYRWSSISSNGVTWSPLAPQDVNGKAGAPKMNETFEGWALVPLRGSGGGGSAYMLGVDSSGTLHDFGYLGLGTMIYGQVVKFTPTTGGVVWARDSGVQTIRWRPFTITPATP